MIDSVLNHVHAQVDISADNKVIEGGMSIRYVSIGPIESLQPSHHTNVKAISHQNRRAYVL